MPSLNKVILIGHLGQDPEVRQTQSGKDVCSASLATTEKFGDKEYTEWHNLVLWGQPGTFLAQYASKGDLVYVEGSIRTEKWEDKEGQKRTTVKINVNQVKILSQMGKKGEKGKSDADIFG